MTDHKPVDIAAAGGRIAGVALRRFNTQNTGGRIDG